jgi:hypothetical protein
MKNTQPKTLKATTEATNNPVRVALARAVLLFRGRQIKTPHQKAVFRNLFAEEIASLYRRGEFRTD